MRNYRTFIGTMLLCIIGYYPLYSQSTKPKEEGSIVMDYRDYKFFDDEPDYKIYEDNVDLKGFAYCKATNKLYVLDDKQNIIEYDFLNALNGDVVKREFHLPFAVELTSNTMEISPNGNLLAFVDADAEKLHIVDVTTGKETASCKLGKKYYNTLAANKIDKGHPFCFLSDNEILVSGTERALLYKIDKNKHKVLDFDKEYRGMVVTHVTSMGTITGYPTERTSFVNATIFVEDGKIKKEVKNLSVSDNYNFYTFLPSGKIDEMEFYDKQNGEKLDLSQAYLGSDMEKYNRRWNKDKKTRTIQVFQKRNMSVNDLKSYDVLKKYALCFPDNRFYEWLYNNQILFVCRNDKRIELYNHTLTDNEMCKQALLTAIDANSVEAIDQFLTDFGDSRYADIAKQKKNVAINNEWQQLSSKYDFSYNHAKEVARFIAKYQQFTSVEDAKEELDNAYKGILERIPEDNVAKFNEYISTFAQSPYIDLAREKLSYAQQLKQERDFEARQAGLTEQSQPEPEANRPSPPSINAPEGALNGVFSVSASRKVYFSKGNLQYQASTNTWRFAEKQTDIVGADNDKISQNNSGWIDLFGWGTSGYPHGAICYQPWSTSENVNDYCVKGNITNDLSGKADWGYNAISNGGNRENLWRTLTGMEWEYLLNKRNTPSGIRFVYAEINNVFGVIILPDNWDVSYFELKNPNGAGRISSMTNYIKEEEWVTSLEPYGAAFLPAAGERKGSKTGDFTKIGRYIEICGRYWSGSRGNNKHWSNDPNNIKFFTFTDGGGGSGTIASLAGQRSYGRSVRLVRNVQ